MTLKELTAVFTIYANNFKVLHWGAIGRSFDVIHNQSEKYYNMLSEDLDKIAEMALRLNEAPAVHFETTKILAEFEDRQFFIFETYKDCNFEDFTKISTVMLQDIVICLIEVLHNDDYFDFSDSDKVINTGIKAELEGLVNKYDLEARYLSARRFANDKGSE